jgi:hypothetical protein
MISVLIQSLVYLLIFHSFHPGLGELNSSSYWLGDDLYIYDFGLAKSCQHLNMGFGMMMPDWMISDAYVVPQGPVWHAHKYDATSIAYVPTLFNSKSSPDGAYDV